MTRMRDTRTVRKNLSAHAVPRGTFHLLLIGINPYDHFDSLNTPVADAKAMRKVLIERYGFLDRNITEIGLGENNKRVSAAEIDIALGAYVLGDDALEEDDSLLIYFAGHGALNKATGKGAWLPTEAGKKETATWFENSKVKDYLANIPARHILLISDSCFAGDFFRGSVECEVPEHSDAYMSRTFAKTSRQALTSGGLEVVADEGFGGHSVFAHFLLKGLRENESPYLFPSDLHNRIKGGVAQNGDQTPMLGYLAGSGGEEGGEFTLFLDKTVIDTSKITPSANDELSTTFGEVDDTNKHIEVEGIKKWTSGVGWVVVVLSMLGVGVGWYFWTQVSDPFQSSTRIPQAPEIESSTPQRRLEQSIPPPEIQILPRQPEKQKTGKTTPIGGLDIPADIGFGDDSSEWARDGECDDPRFTGAGMARVLLDQDLGRDATDCRTLLEVGRIELNDGNLIPIDDGLDRTLVSPAPQSPNEN